MIALYYPPQDDEQILRLRETMPCHAEIISLEEGHADLLVVDHFQAKHLRQQVVVVDSPAEEHPPFCVLQ